MSDSPVLLDTRDGVAVITLNRPDRLNAFTQQMGRGYVEALREADADPRVRVAVVTGAGRGFCSGADLTLLAQGPVALQEFAADQAAGALPTVATEVSIPVVMAVNGPAAGLGFVVALSGDATFAAPTASFIPAFSRLGLVAEYASAWLLSRQVGRQRASEILLSGRVVDADEALRIGLVQAVTEDPLDTAIQWALDVAANCSPHSLATMKRQFLHSALQDFSQSMAESLALMNESFEGPDFSEAITAKMQKRQAVFRRHD